MTASASRSTYWFRASAPPVAIPVPSIVWIARARLRSPPDATTALAPAVIVTYPAMPGLVSSYNALKREPLG
jgi:hypothetical protein